MSNFKMSRLAVIAVAAGAVILFSAEPTQAGGFSIRIGGLSVGSWDNGCVQRSYICISDYDDGWGPARVCRSTPRYHHRPRHRVRPYCGGGRFGTMPFRSGGHHRRR